MNSFAHLKAKKLEGQNTQVLINFLKSQENASYNEPHDEINSVKQMSTNTLCEAMK